MAKALRLAAYEHLKNEPKAIAAFFEKIFGGKPLKSDVADHAAVENEIRGNLLKAGGAAFVPEDPKAFLPMETVRKIILAAGGIPTYPFLADDAKGGFTDFEQDVVKTAETLRERGIFSVEFLSLIHILGGGVYGFVPYMGLSLTYDHRALDGGEATRFVKQIATEIENLDFEL